MVDFITPLSNKDLKTCQLLIVDLKKTLPNEIAAWEYPLTSLLKAIELHYHHETLLGILKELPPHINEALWFKVLAATSLNPVFLKTLIAYINTLTAAQKSHQVTLINNILSTPIEWSNQVEVLELFLKLNGKEKIVILNQLAYKDDGAFKKIYLENSKQFLMYLSNYVAKSDTNLQNALSEDATLANLIITQLLETQSNEKKQKKLLQDVFKNSKNHNWHDRAFNQVIQSKLIALLPKLQGQEVKEFFRLYVNISPRLIHSVPNRIKFLDHIYAATNNSQIISNCIEAIDDAEHQFIISFLTLSKINDSSLRQLCLKKVDIKQFTPLYEPMLALSPAEQDFNLDVFTDYIQHFCNCLKNQPQPKLTELFKQLANTIQLLPESEDQLAAIQVTTKSLSTPVLRGLWLQTLNSEYKEKALVFPHLVEFIKENPQHFDDATLLILIEELFTTSNLNSDFKNIIKPILLIFCQRLYTAQDPAAPVHQWMKKPFAEKLVHALLESPDCAQQLTQTYSTFYTILAWTNATHALKYRMDAILNLIELEQEKINHITVCWLEHFQNQPDQLHTLFNTLNSTAGNRNEWGKKNLLGLKQALWKLIKLETPYKEEEYLTLISNLKPTAIKQILSTVPQKTPAITDTNMPPKEINEEYLVNQLVSSTKETYLANWKKTVTWLKEQPINNQLSFAKRLIENLRTTLSQVKPLYLNTKTFQILNSIILNNAAAFSSKNSNDQNSIISYLKLLHQLIQKADHNKSTVQLKQLKINLLNTFTNRDDGWSQLILKEPAFTETLLSWIQNLDLTALEETTHDHPLTQLIIDSKHLLLDPELKQDPLFQQFIKALLITPPLQLKSEQFDSLFNLLTLQNQNLLAQNILVLPILTPIHIQSITKLTNILSPVELFKIYESHHNPAFIAVRLLAHKRGLNSLSDTQQKKLFDSIDNSAHLLEVINNQFSLVILLNFIKGLYRIYGQDVKTFSNKLGQWLITPEVLAAIANYTIYEPHQEILHKVLGEKTYYQEFINEYLHRPTLNMPLSKQSSLYIAVRNSLSQTNNNKPCSAQLIKELSMEELFVIMKKNFHWTRNVQALEPFFSPFKADGSVALALLRSARWQQRLGLIHSGLLEVLNFYQQTQTSAAIKEIIKQTDIYKNFLLPLLNNSSPKVLDEILPTQLFSALSQYVKVIENLDPAHYKRIQDLLTKHTATIELMKHFAIPQLYNYFSADSVPELISPRDTPHNGEHHKHQVNTTGSGQKWLKHYDLKPEKRFTDLLDASLSACTANQQNEIEQWFLQCALLSTFPVSVETSTLKTFLTSIRPTQLSIFIHSFFKQLEHYHQTQKLLQNLKPFKSIHEFIQQLVNQEASVLQQFNKVTAWLNLNSLNDLILFAEALKTTGLNEGHASVLILSPEISDYQDIKWLNMDLQLLGERIKLVSTKLDQLAYHGFSYNQDAHNDERLVKLTQNNLDHLPADLILGCMNSYGPMFIQTTVNPYQYLKTLNQLLNKFNGNKDLIASLEKSLLESIIIVGVKDPIEHGALLEKLVLSNNAQFCLQQIQLELNRLLQPLQKTQPTCISELSAEQLEYFPAATLIKILTLQRLLFLGKPLPQLHSFTTLAEVPATEKERRMFCADVSMYAVILHLQKRSQQVMQNWLVEQHHRNVRDYAATIESVNTEKEIKYPVIQYYWLCWNSFIMDNLSHDKTMTEGLINWLRTLSDQQLKDSPDLNNLLERIRDKKLLDHVLKAAIEIRKDLSPGQINWLSERCIMLASQDATILSHIINLSSKSWLEHYMQSNPLSIFDLFQAALGNDAFVKDINANKDTQLKFLNDLELYKLTSSQLLKLITHVKDESIRSLLIIHLLCQQDYLVSLKGESILKRLAHPEIHIPSRIQPLIQQLDIKLLSTPLIKKINPETAISIICSVPHFHQLDEEQINALLAKNPDPAAVIPYWLNHYALMPNATFILARLMKLADLHIKKGLSKMVHDKRELIITNMLKQLELFDPIPKMLYENNQEERLIFAIRLFLNGHTHQVYIHYIHQLMHLLLQNENHQFSLPVIQLLMCLNDKQEFTALTNKMTYLTNNYLRSKAQAGEIGIFYHSSRLNIKSMTQTVQLKPTLSGTEAVKGFFTAIFGGATDELGKKNMGVVIPENPLIAELNPETEMSFFKYFLIHYKGVSIQINKAMNDFLSVYTQNKTEALCKSVHEICYLMNMPGIDLQTREALFNSFLHYPDLHDTEISYALLMYDAKRAIQHFGLKGGEKNYNHVINLCNLALENLDDQQEDEQTVINIATKALKEAELELTFNEGQGFFAQLWMRIKRCWVSGWTGFFRPNLPIYVASAPSKTTQDEIPMGLKVPHKPEPDLASLLEENTPWTAEKLKDLNEAISLFSLRAMPKNELEIRQKLHDLVTKLREGSKKNPNIQPWLLQNELLLSTNFARLLELMMINGERSKIDLLIKQENGNLPSLQSLIIRELRYTPAEQEIKIVNKPVAPTPEPGFIANATSGFFQGLGTFFSSGTKPVTGSIAQASETPAP